MDGNHKIYYNVFNKDKVIPALLSNPCNQYIGVDIETNGLNPLQNDILSVALSNGNCTFAFAMNKDTDNSMKGILSELIDNGFTLAAHHAKFDIGFFYAHGLMESTPALPIPPIFCTMLTSQILNNGLSGRHNLIDTLKRYLNVDLIESTKKDFMRELYISSTTKSRITVDMLDYVAGDVMYLPRLVAEQLRVAKLEPNQEKAIGVDNDLIVPLISMELGGCLIDEKGWEEEIPVWQRLKDHYESLLDIEIRKLAETFPQLAVPYYVGERTKQTLRQSDLFGNDKVIEWEAKRIPWGSQAKVLAMINLMGLPLPIKTDPKTKQTKGSIEAGVVQAYIYEHIGSPLEPIFPLLVKFGEYRKLLSTYGRKFLDKLGDDKHVRTSYTQCRTLTGRLSSSGPNLQNIPSLKHDEHRDLREFFIARPGYKFITSDMNSAEVAIAADYSKEPMLLKSLLEGLDLHSLLGSVTFSTIFDKPFTLSKKGEDVTIDKYTYHQDDLRTDHKPVLFAKFYKAGAGTIFKQLSKYMYRHVPVNQHTRRAKRISDDFDDMLPKLDKYLSTLITKANKKKYLIGSKVGRVRYFPNGAYGEAANFPIQNTNAEAMKLAIINFYKWLIREGVDARMVMTVHDELVVEAKEDITEYVSKRVQEELSYWLSWLLKDVECGASVSILNHWKK